MLTDEAISTLVRRGAILAVTEWPALSGLFRELLIFDTFGKITVPVDPQPSVSQLPALYVYPSISGGWAMNQEHSLDVTLSWKLWTGGHYLAEPERILEEIIVALYQSNDTTGQPYARPFRNTGRTFSVSDISINQITMAPALLGSGANAPKVTLTQFQTISRAWFNPASGN